MTKCVLFGATCLIALLVGSSAAQTPNVENAYYEKRVSIVGFPSSTAFTPSSATVTDTKSVLQNLRLMGVRYRTSFP